MTFDARKKSITVLRSNCGNKIIISDMCSVLEKEFMHLDNALDAATNHNAELISTNKILMKFAEHCATKFTHGTRGQVIEMANKVIKSVSQ